MKPAPAARREPPRFVFFDAGFTLIEPWPSVGFHYARLAAAHGKGRNGAAAAALDRAFPKAWRDTRARLAAAGAAMPYGRNRAEALEYWSGVLRETFRLAGEPLPGAPEFCEEVFEEFARGRCWRVFPDVEPALERLRTAGARLGVMSNWDARLRVTLRDLGLDRHFETVLLSCDVGAEKPDPRIFRAAERAVDLPPGALALIGDEPLADGHGARGAGWRQCLIVRGPGETAAAAAAPADGLVRAGSLSAAVELLFPGAVS